MILCGDYYKIFCFVGKGVYCLWLPSGFNAPGKTFPEECFPVHACSAFTMKVNNGGVTFLTGFMIIRRKA